MLSGVQPMAGAGPASEPATALDHQGLVALGRYLRQINYRHIAVTPLTHAYNHQRLPQAQARNLRDILGWSRPFERSAVTAQEFELMFNAGILTREGDHLWRASLRWASLEDLLCAHSAFPTDAEDAVFFGPDTYRFARLIGDYLRDQSGKKPLRRAADIGCGSGAGALLIARACPTAQVVAVDINPKALALTAINAELAGAIGVNPVHSNLLDNVQGCFDLIIANPPYMVDAQQRAYRHGGGEFGEGLSKQIINAALKLLSPGGTLLLYTGVAIIDGKDPFLSALEHQLHQQPCHWSYSEIDPDVFSDELLKPAYRQVERIAAVALQVTLFGE